MLDTRTIQASLAESRARFDAAIADLPSEALEETPAVGTWPVRNVVAHLIDWHTELLLAAEHGLGGAQPAGHPITDDDYNAKSVARHSGEDWAQLAASFRATFDRAVAIARDSTPEQLAAPATYPWGGDGTVEGMLVALVEHQDEHNAQLESWRATGIPA
jgi:uncharacterized protein (TIGR03083 family)